MIASLAARALHIPFKAAFSHASASRDEMQSLWVEARLVGGAQGFGEGCPREYVTGESLKGALSFVESIRDDLMREVSDLVSLRGWATTRKADIDRNPAAWCAVELALLDALARQKNCSVEALLDLPELCGNFHYSAVIGDGPPQRFAAELARYREAGFSTFKIKLSGDRQRDRQKVAALQAAQLKPSAVRADANNLWQDAAAAADSIKALDYAFWALEEPLQAGDLAGMDRLAVSTGASIILDESLLRVEQLARFAKTPSRWIVNLRVSKMGGLLRSLTLLEHLRELGLRVIVGAHVGETSLLTRAALTIASAAGNALVTQEGAFGTYLLEGDVTDPPLMFGPGGILRDHQIPKSAGFGIAPVV
jgi:L-alanine-DL-glutamate epimerase-like enolase superfamily enzyme